LARPSVFSSFSNYMSASTKWGILVAAPFDTAVTWTTPSGTYARCTDISTVVFCWFHHEIHAM